MKNDELSCPLCGEALIAQKRLGVVIYACEEHGTWLFKGVLQEMLWTFSRADSALADAAIEELQKTKRWPATGGE